MAFKAKRKNTMKFYHIHVCENDSARIKINYVSDSLNNGMPFDWPEWRPSMDSKGNLYDWIGGYSWAPYVSDSVQKRLSEIENIQWHGPFLIEGRYYFLMNVLSVMNCITDDSTSNKTFFNQETAANYQIFRPRIEGKNCRQIFVSESFKKQTEAAGETGLRFGLIKSDGWEDFPF
jgi:hypothetical protein